MRPDILPVDSVERYNELFGFETRHPQVAVVEFDRDDQMREYSLNWGLYALFLKQTKGCVINYGRTKYDYDDQTVVCIAPGQTTVFEPVPGTRPRSIGVIFHPDFLFRTPLAQKIKTYTYFSYEANEALHLSAEERVIVHDCLLRIRAELQRPLDRYSKGLIIANLELLLDYCLRFYTRQFITRDEMNCHTLTRFERLLDDYLQSDAVDRHGIPNVCYFAERVHLSPNYFGDLVKRETGKTAQEYIQLKMIALAKERLLAGTETVSRIAYSLGFQYPQHFIRFFKRETGRTPKEFRLQN